MSQPRWRWLAIALTTATLVALVGQPATAAPTAQPRASIDESLLAQLGPGNTAGFLVYLREKADLSGAAELTEDAKAAYVFQQLSSKAAATQVGVRAELDARQAQYTPFWIVNALYVKGDLALVDALAAMPEVERIEPSKTYQLIEPALRTEGASTQAVEWGLTNIEAPRVWSEFGVRGEGIVIANIDTGVQFDHPALVGKYRGNLGGGSFDHNYNWFDPSEICGSPAPCDNNDHGTHTMGTMVGDDGGANQIGVAPGAKWIAAKGCESNNCSDFALLASGQWIVAPTDLNGANPRPDLRPDIVNNSWGGGGGDPWYQATVNAWIAAGIFPMFSNGNSGPSCGSAGSPGDYSQSYAAGAYDINNTIAGFSSRGPSDTDGGLKPNIAAPGVNVRSSVAGGGYAAFNGTSMASPHVAGTVALMWSAAPSLRGDLTATKAILDDTATDVNATTCGGTIDDNNVFGEGRLNAYQAVNASPRGDVGRAIGLVTDEATGDPLAGATVSAGTSSVVTGADGRYTLTLVAGDYTLTASKFGYVSESVSITVPVGGSVTTDFALAPAPFVTISGTVTDGSGHGWPLYARIDVAGKPDGPVYTNPANGRYSFSAPANNTYQFTTTALYPGYTTVSTTVVVGGGNKVQNIAVPVDPACTAKGYQAAFAPPFVSETFDTLSLPAGWSVVNRTASGGWTFNDPGARGNLTGGTGGFAIMDSDKLGIGNSQDSDLIMPVQDFSALSAPYLRFNSDYRAFSNSIIDVDVSTNGGTTWSNVFHATTTNLRGPRVEQIALTPAANAASVTIRFRYRGTWAWWWQVDNVQLTNLACTPIPGGLVVGFTTDRNTDTPLNGVTVTSDDAPADKGVSAATPDDPNIPDGFYWLFSSLTGTHNFTATKSPYKPLTKSVTVVADGVKRTDFALRAGRLTVTPTTIQSFQPYDSVRTTTVKITNTGTAPAVVEMIERTGSFELLSKAGAALQEIHAKEFSKGVNLNAYGGGAAQPGAAPAIDPAWTSIANYPGAVFDNAAAVVDGKVYGIGGGSGTPMVNRTVVYDPTTNTWSNLPNMPSGRSKPAVAAVDGKIYAFGGWGPGSVPVATVDVFDTVAGTWSTVAGATNPAARAAAGVGVANGKIYLVGGCTNGACATSNSVVVFDTATNTFSTAAPYPHNVAWISCGGISGTVYCAGGVDAASFSDGFAYDPGANSWSALPAMPLDLWASAGASASGLLVLAGGVTNNFTTITNRSVAYDPVAGAWMNLPNMQFTRFRAAGACGAYRLGGSPSSFVGSVESERLGGLDQCDEAGDVPWLSTTPTTTTIAAGSSKNITVTLTAKPEAGVSQPGKYTAELGILSDTPYAVPSVDVEMNVLPPSTWGKIQGTVTGTNCDGSVVGVPAIVRVNLLTLPDTGYTLKADGQGHYAYWVPRGRYEVIVAKDGWIPEAQRVTIDAGFVLTLDFNLEPVNPCPATAGPQVF